MSDITLARAVADVQTDGRNLSGIAVPFDRPTRVQDRGNPRPYREAFAPKAFHTSIAQRGARSWPLMLLHGADGASPVPLGAVQFRAGRSELEFTARISDTAAGNEALALVNDGALRDVSIRARPVAARDRSDAEGPYVYRTEVALMELSLAPTGFGQIPGAEVLAVRAHQLDDGPGRPRLEALRRRRSLLVLP